MTDPNLIAAKRLAELGLNVFPCDANKRPRPGVKWKEEATTDARRIESWWRRYPNSLPAFSPGQHGLVAIDCDRHGKEDGVAALVELAQAHEDDPRDWPTVETPSSGRHIFFRQDGSLTNARGTLPAGIDVRGSGGYVIAEGATLPDGRDYHAIGDGLMTALSAGFVPDLPAWLRAALQPPQAEPGTTHTTTPRENPASGHVDHPRTTPTASPASGGGPSEFFRKVNDAALARLADWVPDLFPRARPQPGTGAFRIRSRDLGRALQEDLSIAPTGIMDFGVHDMGDARGGKRTPIDLVIEHGGAPDAVAGARWLCDRLGIDANAEWDASRRDDGVEIRLTRQLNGLAAPDPVEDDEPDDEAEEGEAPAIDEALTHVDGVLGQIVDFIVATSRRPNRRLALSAALPLCATLLGRRMATPTGAGLQLYVIATYPTGGGKQHQLDAIDRLLRAADMGRHIGPSQFMSMSALVRHVANSPLTICAQDEFGAMLKRLSHPRASTHEQGISMVLRSLWGAHFSTVKTPAYATTSSVEIAAPCLSLYGPTTPGEFYEAMRGKDIANGFLNRFLVIDGGERVAEVEPRRKLRDVPDSLRDGMMALYRAGQTGRGNLSGFVCKNTAPDPEPMLARWQDQRAHDVYRDLSATATARMDADPEMGEMMSRVAEIALRCATIRGVSRDPQVPTVSGVDMDWAAALAWQSMERMIGDAGRYMVDPLGAAEFERKLLAKVRTGGPKGVRMRELHRHMSRHQRFSQDLRNTLDALARSGVIVVDERKVPGGVSRRVRIV